VHVREDGVRRKSFVFGLTVVGIWLLGELLVSVQDAHDKGHAELAKALMSAKVSLAEGLSARAQEGTPISGKFELAACRRERFDRRLRRIVHLAHEQKIQNRR
jgi:hypothetical protein